jgi:FkbM family methyltransferase
VHDGDVVLDVGANIGVWSRELLAHRQLGAVYAFEAAACAFRMLQKNLASYPDVHCENVAVGAENGVAKFRDDIGGQNRVISDLYAQHESHESNQGHTVTVPIVAIDTWAERVGLTRLDVMKVDVEGGELDVFRGAEHTLRRFFPVIYFEYLPETGAIGAAKTQAFEWLTELGYKMQAVLADGCAVPVATPEACAQLATYSNDVIALPPKTIKPGRPER